MRTAAGLVYKGPGELDAGLCGTSELEDCRDARVRRGCWTLRVGARLVGDAVVVLAILWAMGVVCCTTLVAGLCERGEDALLVAGTPVLTRRLLLFERW